MIPNLDFFRKWFEFLSIGISIRQFMFENSVKSIHISILRLSVENLFSAVKSSRSDSVCTSHKENPPSHFLFFSGGEFSSQFERFPPKDKHTNTPLDLYGYRWITPRSRVYESDETSIIFLLFLIIYFFDFLYKTWFIGNKKKIKKICIEFSSLNTIVRSYNKHSFSSRIFES